MASSSSSHASGSGSALPPCRHLRVNLADPSLVKHMLDDQAALYVLDAGYAEDVSLSNAKIGLSLLAVALTALAQLYPLPFPDNAALLKACVAAYFAIQIVLQLLQWTAERNCILLTKPRDAASSELQEEQSEAEGEAKKGKAKSKGTGKKSKASKSSPAPSSPSSADASGAFSLPSVAVRVHSHLPRYETEYRLTVSSRLVPSLLADVSASLTRSTGAQDVSVSVSFTITDLFDANGVLLLERYHQRLAQLMQQFAEEANRAKSEQQKKSD